MPLTILLVEDYEPVRQSVKETLEWEGWRVETCVDGFVASLLIKSEARYDLLLLDNELPNISGLELTRRARGLPHRKETPIIMLSATDSHREAYQAGVNVFLKKPEGVKSLVESVNSLIE